MKKTVCVFTGSRAEYGLLKPLLSGIKGDRGLSLQLLVSGTHLSPGFGSTYKEIETDGFNIDRKVDMRLNSDTPLGVTKSMAAGLAGFASALDALKPDIIVILGDRFEAFMAAAAAMIARIPIAHISGGEATFGLIDEAIRHSITKMSHLHFTSTEEYRKRVIQLGEDPKRVFNVGSTCQDNIKGLKLLPKKALERELGLKFNKRNVLVTYHPVTLEDGTPGKQFRNLLDALDGLNDTGIIFTRSNADAGGRVIAGMIDEFVSLNPRKAVSFASLGYLKYLSTLRFVDAVVGNSSSGIIEAPSFGIGTINIGDRQKGRIRAESVIDCRTTVKGIREAFRALYSPKFQKTLKNVGNPYDAGAASPKIRKILKKYDLSDIIKKEFYDIDFHC